MLCRSLLGNNVDPEIMNVSTGKNIFSDITSKEVILHVLWCYGLRFLPAISLLSLAHLVSAFALITLKEYHMAAPLFDFKCKRMSSGDLKTGWKSNGSLCSQSLDSLS